MLEQLLREACDDAGIPYGWWSTDQETAVSILEEDGRLLRPHLEGLSPRKQAETVAETLERMDSEQFLFLPVDCSLFPSAGNRRLRTKGRPLHIPRYRHLPEEKRSRSMRDLFFERLRSLKPGGIRTGIDWQGATSTDRMYRFSTLTDHIDSSVMYDRIQDEGLDDWAEVVIRYGTSSLRKKKGALAEVTYWLEGMDRPETIAYHRLPIYGRSPSPRHKSLMNSLSIRTTGHGCGKSTFGSYVFYRGSRLPDRAFGAERQGDEVYWCDHQLLGLRLISHEAREDGYRLRALTTHRPRRDTLDFHHKLDRVFLESPTENGHEHPALSQVQKEILHFNRIAYNNENS